MSCVGLPHKYDMCIYVGDSFSQEFKWETVVSGVKTPMDLTGGEMWITFSRGYEEELLTKEAGTINPTQGEFTFYLTPIESRDLMGEAYCTRKLKYDIEFRGNVATPPASITTVIAGTLTLNADVTRAAP
jgi:hypothetical protein